MRTPSAESLLRVWEEGRYRHPIDRGLLFFALADPDADPDALAREPLGRRNDAVLRLRFATFGGTLRGYVDCPSCNGRLELEMDGRTLLGTPPERGASVHVDGLSFRLPTSRDLAAVLPGSSVEGSALKLLRLCSETGGGAVDEDRAEGLLDPVEEAMEDADPMAEIGLDVRCESCGNSWTAPFDVVGFLWEEVEAYAVRLLDEIHILAGAYGWSEEAILSLSEARRFAYIQRTLT